MTMSPDWLKEYYQRVSEEKGTELIRKDSFTNWALITLLGSIAIYGQFLLASFPPFIVIGALVVIFILLFRFYLRSCISYANLRRLDAIKHNIETHWLNNDPTFDGVKEIIRIHDHECWSVVSLRKSLLTQLQAGFLVLFLPSIFALLYEIFKLHTNFFEPLWVLASYIALGFLVVYIVMELLFIRKYQPLRQHKSPVQDTLADRE
ncbi:MAG: hypothetical protein ACFE89_12800 [Candidatus Hodarchaeota archaeon]